jgi:hypothetical protein
VRSEAPGPSVFQPLFLAVSVAEVELAVKLLQDQGVEFSVRPEVVLDGPEGRACDQGLLFEVPDDQLATCRLLFASHGLLAGALRDP